MEAEKSIEQKSKHHKLLINEPPLQILPTLAASIGLSQALALQQLHYLIGEFVGEEHDGFQWIHMSEAEWLEQFPFWNKNTIRRNFDCLALLGIVKIGNYNKAVFDKTKWYTIDYDKLDNLPARKVRKGEDSRPNFGQRMKPFHKSSKNETASSSKNETTDSPILGRPIPEIPSEIPKKIPFPRTADALADELDCPIQSKALENHQQSSAAARLSDDPKTGPTTFALVPEGDPGWDTYYVIYGEHCDGPYKSWAFACLWAEQNNGRVSQHPPAADLSGPAIPHKQTVAFQGSASADDSSPVPKSALPTPASAALEAAGQNPPVPVTFEKAVKRDGGLRCPIQECGGMLSWDAGAALYTCPLCGKRYEIDKQGLLRLYVPAAPPAVNPTKPPPVDHFYVIAGDAAVGPFEKFGTAQSYGETHHLGGNISQTPGGRDVTAPQLPEYSPGDAVYYRYATGWGSGENGFAAGRVVKVGKKITIALYNVKVQRHELKVVAPVSIKRRAVPDSKGIMSDFELELVVFAKAHEAPPPKPPVQTEPTSSSETAKSERDKRERKAREPRPPQAWDVWFDAFARCFFGGAKSARVGMILHGSTKEDCPGLIALECERQGKAREDLDYKALAAETDAYARWVLTRYNEIKNCNKHYENWQAWRASKNGGCKAGHYEEKEVKPGIWKKVWIRHEQPA